MRSRLLIVAAVVGVVSISGCDSGGSDVEEPVVVSPSAFTFDSSFPQSFQGGGEHWQNGALRVAFVTLAVGVHLVIPAAATHAATQAEPFVEGGTWIWENTVPIGGTPVTFRLEGTPDGTETDWRMFMSADEEIDGALYDGFELYNATTTLDGRVGQWRLYYLIEDVRTHVLTADFDIDSDAVHDVQYTVPESNPNPDARGSTVLYARNGDARTFDWHQEPEDYDHLVEWSISTHAGSITATNYNGGVRACWDSDLQNTEC
jgi:hypothetical protein